MITKSLKSWLNENLDGLPKSLTALENLAEKENWDFVSGKYPLSALPQVTQDAYRLKTMVASTPTMPAIDTEQNTAVSTFVNQSFNDKYLSANQRTKGEARCVVVQFVESLIIQGVASSSTDACRQFCKALELGNLPSDIIHYANLSNGKPSDNRTLGLRTLQRWVGAKKTNGLNALAPKKRAENSVPVWAKLLLKAYGRPQKPSIYEAIDMATADCLAIGITPPSLSQAKRLISKMSSVEKLRGRVSARDMRSHLPFNRRSTAQTNPADIYGSDGHTFKAEILHPISGKAFRPEVTSIIDEKTRMCVGWSTAESENTFGTIEAMRMAFVKFGIPAVWYVDNGKGFNNKMMDDNLTGFLARLDITKKNSIAYNSQARGKVERSHQSIWVKAARTLDSFMGKRMDTHAKQIFFKKTRKDMQVFGTTSKLISFKDFKDLCQQFVDEYNNRPHAGLDKITCPTTSRRRHMSPVEAWKFYSADITIPKLSEDEATDTFRPYEIRKVNRGELSIGGQQYFHAELAHYNKDEVLVGYDIMDASKIWVRELIRNADIISQGRLICVAEFEANHIHTQPKSVMDKSIENRNAGVLKRIDTQREQALEKMGDNPHIVDHVPNAELTATFEQMNATPIIDINERANEKKPEYFSSDFELLQHLAGKNYVSAEERKQALSIMEQAGMEMRLSVAGLEKEDLLNKWAEPARTAHSTTI